MRGIFRVKPLRAQHGARQAAEPFFKLLRIRLTGVNDGLVGDMLPSARNPQKHQGTLHQTALGAVFTGAVHADRRIDHLVRQFDTKFFG